MDASFIGIDSFLKVAYLTYGYHHGGHTSNYAH